MNIDTSNQALQQAKTMPAHLWFGAHDFLVQQTITYLQKQFCNNNACTKCIICQQVKNKQHHAILWLYPEKNYTLEELEPIASTISYTLAPQQHFYFVIQKADFLTPACANSLLKSIEEPPTGYHFILLAERQEAILPTIRSRCVTKSFLSQHPKTKSLLFNFFTTDSQSSPQDFLAALDQSKINERESIELLDALLMYWIDQFKKSITIDVQLNKFAANMIDILNKAVLIPPMPGSSKIFWKNLFLQIK